MNPEKLFDKIACFFWEVDPYEAADHAGTFEEFRSVVAKMDIDTATENLLYFATYGGQDERPTARHLLNEVLIFADMRARLTYHKERSAEA